MRESLSERETDRKQPASLPACQHRRRQRPDPATPHPHPLSTTTTATHRHASRTYTLTPIPPSTPTRYTPYSPATTPTPTHNNTPHALAAPQSSSSTSAAARTLARPSACLPCCDCNHSAHPLHRPPSSRLTVSRDLRNACARLISSPLAQPRPSKWRQKYACSTIRRPSKPLALHRVRPCNAGA